MIQSRHMRNLSWLATRNWGATHTQTWGMGGMGGSSLYSHPVRRAIVEREHLGHCTRHQ